MWKRSGWKTVLRRKGVFCTCVPIPGCPGGAQELREDRSVPVRSDSLGLYGVADVVEMRPGPDGRNIPYPVEYKRGSPKIEDWDRAQLCAQAMCLEEMVGVEIPEGAIFYGKPRRRERVMFGASLRRNVVEQCKAMHAMVQSATTPAAVYGKHCQGCSLCSTCMPKSRFGQRGKIFAQGA